MGTHELVIALVVGFLVAEILAVFAWLAERIVRKAADRLPEPTRTRYLDEWVGELDVVKGGIPKIVVAMRVLIRADGVRQVLSPPELTAPGETPSTPSAATALPRPGAPLSLRMRSLDPGALTCLDGFTTGSYTPWQQDVNEAIREAINLVPETDTTYTVRVAEDVGTGQVAAVSVYAPKPLITTPPSRTFDDAVYVAVLGVSDNYHGVRVPGEDKSIGDLMLGDVLGEIRSEHGGRMPFVWALNHADNRAARSLFAKHRFWPLQPQGSNDYGVYIRGSGL